MLEFADCVELRPRTSEMAESASELSCDAEEESTSRTELFMLEAAVLAVSAGSFGFEVDGCPVVERGGLDSVGLVVECAISAPWESI
jgi:hypothetical protein